MRGRLALVCAGFVVLALLQAPGRIVGDTKLDLAVDPLGFLSRALTLWEPLGSAGQVQNQAYGYFFPMGPFFALGDLAGLPPWVVQRLWWAALMSVAFLGVVVLARRLGIGTPGTALVAGIAYALAPRMLTAMGETSVELLPMALAPWVIMPLAGAAVHGRARRAAALSGLAVLLRRRRQRRRHRRRPAAGGAVPADPPGRAAAPAAGPVVGGRGRAGDGVVARAAAAAGPVQPAVPLLHRERPGDDRPDATC